MYNSFFSSALKNLFECINYKKTEGKVAGIVILSASDILDLLTSKHSSPNYYHISE